MRLAGSVRGCCVFLGFEAPPRGERFSVPAQPGAPERRRRKFTGNLDGLLPDLVSSQWKAPWLQNRFRCSFCHCLCHLLGLSIAYCLACCKEFSASANVKRLRQNISMFPGILSRFFERRVPVYSWGPGVWTRVRLRCVVSSSLVGCTLRVVRIPCLC